MQKLKTIEARPKFTGSYKICVYLFISATSPLALCMYKFVLNLFYFFFAVQGSDYFKKAYLCFRLACTSGK